MKVVIGSLVVLLLAQENSGYSLSKAIQGRITEGKDAIPGQFPYQVSLQWGIPPFISMMHFCGGSIINQFWVLTAGHCVTDLPIIGRINVKVGKHYIHVEDEHVQTGRIIKKIVHKEYSGGVAPNDVALLKLKKPLIYNSRVRPVALPVPNSVQTGEAVLSGWGSTSKSYLPKLPTVLQMANVPVVANEDCVKAMAKLYISGKIYDTQMCTGPLDGTISACSGDSGGPLVQYENDVIVQVGIVSWGIVPCGSIGAPSVYTRVSSFVEWIYANVEHN